MTDEMKDELKKAVKVLANKCGSTVKPDEALKYTQAALNAAHALQVVTNVGKTE